MLELIGGPRKEGQPEALRARIKAAADGAGGWVTIKDRTGTIFAESNPKLYLCMASVALTDAENVNTCKVLRKLGAGELFEAIGELTEAGRASSADGVAAVMDKDA